MSPLVRASSVSHRYGAPPLATCVLEDLSLEIMPNELTVVMGPSGSGKTTLISILAGLLRPSAGVVELCGADITKMNDGEVTAARRRSVGFVFQAFHLFASLSATDNVAEVLVLFGAHIGAARTAARALLETCGLEGRLDALPAELSAGQRQRVAIARALAPRPRIVIADEPTASLDGATAKGVMCLLRDYVGPKTGVLLVTHDARLVRPEDRVIELADGRVVGDRPAQPGMPEEAR